MKKKSDAPPKPTVQDKNHIVRRLKLSEYGYERYDTERDDQLREILLEALLGFPEFLDKSYVDKAWNTWVEECSFTYDKGVRIKRKMQRSDTDFLGYQLLMPLMKKYGCKELDEIPAKVKESQQPPKS